MFFSIISSNLNASAAILLEEVVRPFRPKLSEKSATMICKALTFGVGAVSIILVLFARYFGSGVVTVCLQMITRNDLMFSEFGTATNVKLTDIRLNLS